MTVVFKNCQGHYEEGKSEKFSLPREAYGNMSTKCDIVSWMGSWNKKKTLKKAKENLNRVLISICYIISLIMANVSC